MPFEDIERLIRWAERFYVDLVDTVPLLLDWEMISRVQQFNNAHPQSVSITIGGVTLGLSNTGTGYTGKDASGNPVSLVLPSPIQILEAHFAGKSSGSGEVLSMTMTPASVSLGVGSFTVTLTAVQPGAGPFVLADEFNTALLLPPLTIGTNTVANTISVFSTAGTFSYHVKDQATGISSNQVPINFA